MPVLHYAVDVLVIGMGPAGASAAATAAEAGLTVMAIDRKQQWGVPVQCAEFVPLPMSKYIRTDHIKVQGISTMHTCLPSGEAVVSALPGLMIHRDQFDMALARRAQDQGAVLMNLSVLQKLDAARHIAFVEQDDREFQLHYRVLIAADGPASSVARLLGLPKLESINTRQYTVPLHKPHDATDIWLSNRFPGGYAWMFPKKQFANIGLGLDKHYAADLKKPLDELHQQLVAEGLLGEQIIARTGGLIPVEGLRHQLVVHNSILFAGDAAGLTHPISGAGIASAVLSGELAAQCARDFICGDKAALEDYAEELREQYGPVLERAVRKRQWLKQIWDTRFASSDKIMRQGWIAFDEYFQDEPEPELVY